MNTPDLPKLFECKRCKARYTTLEEFKDHFRIHSDSITVGNTIQQLSHASPEAIPEIATIYINCPDCNELTSNYGVHQLKHFKQICDLCGKLFLSFSGWRRHLKYHKALETGERAHVCDKCGKAFILISALTEHRRLHSKERPHTCNVCGKGFKQKAHLTRHLYIHSDVKPITCKFCGKGFTNNFNMRSHLRSHTGERPFSCSKCGKSFAHNGSLKTHMKSEHNIEMQYVCQTVEEFDNFPRPKLLPGRKRKSETVAGDQKVNIRPHLDEKAKTVSHGRDLQEAFMSITEGMQQVHPIEGSGMDEAEEENSGEQPIPILKALENSNYNKEVRAALLSIAAVSSSVDIKIVDEDHPPGPSHESLHARSYQEEKELDSRVNPTSDSAVWHGHTHSASIYQPAMTEAREHGRLKTETSRMSDSHSTQSSHGERGLDLSSPYAVNTQERIHTEDTSRGHVGIHGNNENSKDIPPVSNEHVVVRINPHESEVMNIHHIPVSVASEQVVESHHSNMGSHGNRERNGGDTAAYDTVEIAIPQTQAQQGHHRELTML